MSIPTTHPDAAIKLKEKLEGLDIAMMTTQAASGYMNSRPMHTSQVESTGILWFFTSDKSGKIEEIQRDNHVNLSYANADDHIYVSIAGRVELVEDKGKMHDLWHPALKAWFPDGLESDDIALLKVTADHAEYWDASSNAMLHLYSVAKAAITGESARGDAEHEKLDIR